MAVKLRLRRMGRKKRPVYSVVATDSRSPRDGRFIEDLGRYEPLADPARVTLNTDRVLYWLQEGAQPSGTVRSLLSREGVLLRLYLGRKGKGAEEIDAAVEAHREAVAGRAGSSESAADRRRKALEAERKKAEEEAKRIAEEKAAREAEIQAQKEAEEAAARAAAEAELAAKAAEAADADAPESTEADAPEAAPAEAAPDVAEEQPAAEAETTEEVEAETGAEVAEQADAAAAEGEAEAVASGDAEEKEA